MADAPKAKRERSNSTADTTIEGLIAGIRDAIANIDTREAIARLDAKMSGIESMLLELRADVPRLTAQAPQPLALEDVEKILADNPHATFVALTHDPRTGLRPGDSFDAALRFKSRDIFLSNLRGQRLKVARAA